MLQKLHAMINSKIIEILKHLSEHEIKKFSDYLNSPFFNKREIITKLFNLYKKYYPGFDEKKFTKERIFHKLMPGKKYNDNIFRNLNSILLKYSEEFLSYLNYSREKLSVKRHLLSELNSKKLLHIFESNFKETKTLLDAPIHKDMNFFYEMHLLYLQKDLFNSYINKFSSEDIFQAEKNLIIYFLMKFMEIQNYILYECRILGLEKKFIFKKNFVDEIMKKVPEEISEIPQIKIYYNAFKLEQTSSEKYYRNLRDLLDKYWNILEKEKVYNNYADMIDFIKRTRPRDEISTVNELFKIRKDIIERKLYTENFITNMFFLNLVKTGLRLKKFDWVNSFIKDFNHLLIDKYRESTAELSYAHYYFELKQYDKSIMHASVVRYEDNFYNLEIKNLYSRIYYEQGLFDVLTDFLNSYRLYISKNRTLSKSDIQNHGSFIRILSKLIRIKESGRTHRVFSLTKLIESEEIISKLWLFEKINELKEI